VQLLQLLLAYSRRRVGHQIDRLRSLGKRNHFAKTRRARKQHDDAVEAKRNAAMRWRAIFERIQKEPESLPRFLITDAQRG